MSQIVRFQKSDTLTSYFVMGLAITITTNFGIIHIGKMLFSAHMEYQHIVFCKYSFTSLGCKGTI